MASPTLFDPSITLPAIITAPPTAQFTPGPGCVDPEDHWVVITSCYAYAVDQPSYSSPDWLTCQLTQFGPPENAPTSCFQPWSAETVVNDITSYYSGCPSGYSGVSTAIYSRDDGHETNINVYCCPSQYNFLVGRNDFQSFTTDRDGATFEGGYPLPGCTASYITELMGRDIAVQTDYNTYGWEKRQVQTVPWDYRDGTMYAESQAYSYTVFYGTHTCYQDCYGWHDYYFSGSTQPPFTVPDIPWPPSTTTPAPTEEPTPTETPSSSEDGGGETQTPPVEETPSPTQETPEPTTQVTPSPSGDDSPPNTQSSESTEPTSTPTPTPTLTPTTTATVTPTPSESTGDVPPSSSSSAPPSTTTSSIPTGAAGTISPTRLILLGLVAPLVAMV